MDEDEKFYFHEGINECPQCGKKFEVTVSFSGYPGGKETEEVWCPYCFFSGYIRTSGLPNPHKITG
jgi:hypothetical protein